MNRNFVDVSGGAPESCFCFTDVANIPENEKSFR